ncbi:hypothetical protein HQ585_17515 [candidate division KSB1 bacterium]|nr:hypothetical protein [candidate division KSB1 bacterium]
MKYLCLKTVLVVSFLGFISFSCDKKPTEPFYTGTTPTLTSIGTDTTVFQQDVTITGENFNPDPTKNIIRFGFSETFGYASARAHTGSITTLTFSTPGVSGEYDPYIATELSVTQEDAQYWSNELDIVIAPVSSIFMDDFSFSSGIAFDHDGNCYVVDRAEGMIYKITPEGEKSEFGDPGAGDLAGELEFGPDGWLYFASAWEGEIRKFPPEGGDYEVVDTGDIEEFRCYGLDFDDAGNMYVTGNWESYLWRITPDGEGTILTEVPHGLSVRVFDGYVYWSVRGYGGEPGEGPNQILKAPITADGIGAIETVFEDDEWTGTYLLGAGGLEIDVEGNVYAISSFWENDKVCKFTPTANGYTAEVLIQLQPAMAFMAFNGEFLYITTKEDALIYKIFAGIEGAPHY